MVMLRFLSRAPVFLAFPPIVRPQPALQAGGRGQCPLGMVNADLLLLLPHVALLRVQRLMDGCGSDR
jgi:hypothetical protein